MLRLAVCVASVLLTACRDEAAEAYARAELQYQSLLATSARPDDARFDGVLRELEKVTSSSKHHPQARRLMESIRLAQNQQVRTPLALGPNGRRPPLLEGQLAACARLAQLAGAEGGVDERVLQALEACRFRAEKLELELSHGSEVDGGGHP